MLGKRQVNYSTFVCRHRFKCKRHFLRLYLLRHLAGKCLKRLVASLFIAFHIDNNREPASLLVPYDKPYYVLEAGKSLSPSADKDTEVVTLYVKRNRFSGFLPFYYGRRLKNRRTIYLQKTEKVVYCILHVFRNIFVRNRSNWSYPDNSFVRPETEYTGLTFAYYVYFYFLPTYA